MYSVHIRLNSTWKCRGYSLHKIQITVSLYIQESLVMYIYYTEMCTLFMKSNIRCV